MNTNSDQDFDLVIEPNKTIANYWKEVFKYRGLLYFFAWRDILVRYKQTVLGIAWSVIRPLLTIVVFTTIFGMVAKLPSQGVPYALLVGAAMLPWQFFANAFTDASNSLLGNSGMLNKVYFPRLILPATSIIVSLIDFLISLIIIVGLMVWYRFMPGIRIVMLPLFILLAITAAYGAGCLVAALNVKYRDMRIIVPFIVQFGLFVSPVGFSSSIVSEKWKFLYALNPMTGVIDGFRWAILGGENKLYIPGLMISITISIVLLLAGISYFRKTERTFADVI